MDGLFFSMCRMAHALWANNCVVCFNYHQDSKEPTSGTVNLTVVVDLGPNDSSMKIAGSKSEFVYAVLPQVDTIQKRTERFLRFYGRGAAEANFSGFSSGLSTATAHFSVFSNGLSALLLSELSCIKIELCTCTQRVSLSCLSLCASSHVAPHVQHCADRVCPACYLTEHFA